MEPRFNRRLGAQTGGCNNASSPKGVTEMAGIVVGIDGSPESQKALTFAVNEARVRGDRLRAISVWQYAPGLVIDHDTGFDVHDKDRVAEAQTAAQAELDIVLAGATAPATELLVCEGDPAQVLIEESREADMLVVGSRGRGSLAGALLGSVSQNCASHAQCPVTVVR
jgi:nucleotide-binding universal stress UspA family protein